MSETSLIHRLIASGKGALAGLVLVLNVLIVFSAMIPVALVKLLLPLGPVRRVTDRTLNFLVETWIAVNSGWMSLVRNSRWQISGVAGLKRNGWYLVGSNHQSWVDILVLQRVFNRRIPLLKFFLKRELIYVPVMGLAWWALDFPFMRRRGTGSVAKDLAAARKSCEKFRAIPTSVMSFLEGTRFTPAKHAAQRSPFKHLLKPKTGGIAMALETLGEQFSALLDVTIVYPHGRPTFWDLLCGRVDDVIVDVREIPIPPDLHAGGTESRAHLQAWIGEIWARKDRTIEARVSGAAKSAVETESA